MDIDNNIFYDEFLSKLAHMENVLLDAQDDPSNKENINEIFRAIHTVKGVADLLCFFDILKLSHKAEDLLDEVRNGKIDFDSKMIYLFLELKKFIKTLIDDKLNGYDMDEYQEKLFKTFEKEIDSHMPKTALIIDKSFFIKNLVNSVESKIKFNIIIAENQEDGLKILKNQNISMLFSDFSVNKDLAIETIMNLKKDPNYKNLPIIIITNQKKEDLTNIGKITSAKAWLAKPFDENQFIFILNKFLSAAT